MKRILSVVVLGLLVGLSAASEPDDAVGCYVDGVWEGIGPDGGAYEDGEILQGYYVDGKRDGVWVITCQ